MDHPITLRLEIPGIGHGYGLSTMQVDTRCRSRDLSSVLTDRGFH
jgi:hypothetical protein